MNMEDVTLMVCPAGTPVVGHPRNERYWHPGSKTWCEHGEPMPFPSQPAVSPYGALVKRLREAAAQWSTASQHGQYYAGELIDVLVAAPTPVSMLTYESAIRAKVEALVQLYEQRRAQFWDAYSVTTDLRRVLTGEYDPRTDPDL